jgi:protein TonB
MDSALTIRPPDRLKAPLLIAMAMHAALLGYAFIVGIHSNDGQNWGGPGGSITVGVVGSVPSIPLPHPDVSSQSRVVDESKGLYKAEPPKVVPPPPDALPIPKFKELKPPPKYVTRPSKILENPTPPPPNAVPYGGGGAPNIPSSSFAIGQGNTQAGLGFTGSGGGDFGSRFSWYVEAVQRRVSSNWLQSTVDPSVSVAPRVVVTFTILRNGEVANIQITHSSNNYSVDASAVRAVKESSPLNPLPPGYNGSNVNVEFWFDFHR